jgi:Zn-dependent metalloprotease
MVKQRGLGQDAAGADWLIGAGLLAAGIDGVALRSMAAPGTAYDDPRLGGRDPQPAHMDGFVETASDNGGVHLNSGIPNKAFQLAATGIGGPSWDGAGRAWYAVLTGGELGERSGFVEFARRTEAAAGRVLGEREAGIVRDAWAAVGV